MPLTKISSKTYLSLINRRENYRLDGVVNITIYAKNSAIIQPAFGRKHSFLQTQWGIKLVLKLSRHPTHRTSSNKSRLIYRSGQKKAPKSFSNPAFSAWSFPRFAKIRPLDDLLHRHGCILSVLFAESRHPPVLTHFSLRVSAASAWG